MKASSKFRLALIFIVAQVLTSHYAHAVKVGPTTITFSPSNPLPGDLVTVTVQGDWFPICFRPQYAIAQLLNGVIRIDGYALQRCGGCIADPAAYTIITTFVIPRESSSVGTHPVEYFTQDCDGSSVLDTSQSLVVSAPQGTCSPAATTLCLGGRRFQVTARWRTVDGQSGDGYAVQLSDRSGLFWFFTPENSELILKVLDACATSIPAFWTFAAGVTNLQVDLTVKDTKSGAVRMYSNPQGSPFTPTLDTAAFRTCP